MELDHYTGSGLSSDNPEFQFTSQGPKGNIVKVVRFLPTGIPDLYNLSFGNLNENGKVDDETINDNNDRNKILTTIGVYIYAFTSAHPNKSIFLCGNTPAKTRLYRMALTINIERLSKDFYLYGVLKNNDDFIRVPFEKNVNYFGFILKRKRVNL